MTATILLCGVTVFGAKEDKDFLLRSGKAALEDGLFSLAEKNFAAYVKQAATRAEKAEGTLYQARALYWKGDFRAASELLEKRAKWAEGTPFEPLFLLLRIRALFEARDLDTAFALADMFMAKYPQHEGVADALRLKIKILLRKRDFSAALPLLEGFEQRFPESLDLADNLLDHAAVLIELGRHREAVQVLEKLAKLFPNTELGVRGILWMARLYLEMGDEEGAARWLSELMQREPRHPEARAQAWFLWATLQNRGTNHAEALAAVEKVLRITKSPTLAAQAQVLQGALWVRQGKKEAGVRAVREHQRKLSETEAAIAQLELADALLAVGDFSAAEQEYQIYLDAFTNVFGVTHALRGRGTSLFQLGRYLEAAVMFDRAAALSSEPEQKADNLFKAGNAYLASERLPQALERYEQVAAISKDPNKITRAKLFTAEVLARMKKPKAAEERLTEIIQTYSNTPFAAEASLRLASLKETEAKWQEALSLYEQVAESVADPMLRFQARHSAGMVRYRLGMFDEALSDFEDVVQQGIPVDWTEQAFYMRGWCLYLLGKPEQAFQVCREFLQTYPNSKWSPDVLFWLGEYAYNRGEFSEAERRFLQVASQYPESEGAPDALYWAGRAAWQQREFTRALEHFTSLARKYPNTARISECRFAQGDVLTELGQFDTAVLAFNEVIAREKDTPLALAAYGRKGDCLFVLASEAPARYAEAIAAYQTVADHPRSTKEMRYQAEYKIGRCKEKLGLLDEAVEKYMNVVYSWLADLERGEISDPVWFARAAFGAAEIKESQKQWSEAESIYRRVVETGIPAAALARERIQKLQEKQMPEESSGARKDTASKPTGLHQALFYLWAGGLHA